MAITKYKISSVRDLPKGSRVVTASVLANATSRINTAMTVIVKNNQKMQRISHEKAAQTVLNA